MFEAMLFYGLADEPGVGRFFCLDALVVMLFIGEVSKSSGIEGQKVEKSNV